MECCWDQHGTIIYIRALQGHSHGVAINPNMFSLTQIPLNWKLFQVQIGPREWSMVRRNESKKHKTSLFFSTVNPQESSSRQRTIEWKGLDGEPRMVLYKHRDCPDHDCISYFNVRHAQMQIWYFIKVALTFFFLQQDASKRTGQGCHFCRRSLVREEIPNCKHAEGDCLRADRRMPGKPAIPNTQDEKAEAHFLFPA